MDTNDMNLYVTKKYHCQHVYHYYLYNNFFMADGR